MEHFINIIYKESADQNGIAECVANSTNMLNESTVEFYTGELNSDEKVLTMVLPEAIKDIDNAAQDIAMRLFEFGLNDFDIEITEDETIARTLRRGMRGEDVKRIQRELGMPAAEQDGIFGPKTERAVRTFQQNSGIQVDGIIGRQTQSAILKYRNPGRGISVQTPGPAYIDTPPPKTQPSTGMSDLRKRQQQQQQPGDIQNRDDPETPTPKLRPKARPEPTPNQPPVGGGGNISNRPQQVVGREPQGAYKVITGSGQGTRYRVYDADGNEIRNGRGKGPTNIPTKQQYQGADTQDRPTGRVSPRLDQKGQTPVDPSAGSTAPNVSTDNPVQPVSDPDENEPRSTTVRPNLRPGSADPDVDTTGPAGMTAPDIDDTPTLPGTNDATQRQQQQQDNWEKKYGSAPRDLSAGLPAEFTTQYLNPALEDLTSDAAGELATEVKGAPPPVARLVMDRMKKMLGIEDGDELLDMAREIEQDEPDQASALSTLAEIYKELEETAMPKDESVKENLKNQIIASLDENLEETFDNDEDFYETYGIMWYNEDEEIDEAEYQGRKVKLGKPMAGDVKKFKVYVKNPKGNVVKVNFGQKGAKIKKDNPNRRRSFRARHNCDNPGPRHKARYWSCRKW